MTSSTLVLANKAYSSWSMRAWLALRHVDWRFEEIVVPLYLPDSRAKLLAHSPAGKAPCLRDGDVIVWESLAICEYAAEKHPTLWPRDAAVRAHARAVSNEMHAGFGALRNELPFNCRRHYPDRPKSDAVRADIARITAIWEDCRRLYGKTGDAGMLFGEFSIADAMYAPVVSRFNTYGVALGGAAKAYAEAVAALPLFREWTAAGSAETWVIDSYEA